jgi:hypothetical protein
VLITKEYDNDNDIFNVVQTTNLDGVRPSLALGFKSESKRDECFNDYNEEKAGIFLQTIRKMLEDDTDD